MTLTKKTEKGAVISMRKVFAVSVILLVCAACLAGCAIAPAEETAAQPMPDAALEQLPAADWPDTGVGALVPPFTAGTQAGLVYDDNACTAYCEGVQQADVDAYIATLTASSFDKNVQSYTDAESGVFSFFADNGAGVSVALTFTGDTVGIDIGCAN